jgi:hypothetical protein
MFVLSDVLYMGINYESNSHHLRIFALPDKRKKKKNYTIVEEHYLFIVLSMCFVQGSLFV